ncbi:uncharacterized protein SCHCODRAFT_02521539 [Schizophyllum commune H4-8]|nr:uncharacterized protein SCHCODRAFT_02521539 [Schizophyllum commune H4-8]KAI5884962.1 hypothetical protein SCHCODRAFT_02521539 [Schizophyllum commune H4-8]
MSRYKIPFEPPNAQIRCLAHVVNLVVQKILSVLKEVDSDPDVEDYYELFLKQFLIHFSYEDDEELREWEAEGGKDGEDDEDKEVIDMSVIPDEVDACKDAETEDEVRAAFEEEEGDEDDDENEELTALEKLCAISKKIVGTPQSRMAFWKEAKEEYGNKVVGKSLVARLMPVRDMKAIDLWTWWYSKGKHCSLALSARDWDTIKMLNSILQIFTHITKIMSQSKTPTLPWALLMYEHMRKKLNGHIHDTALPLYMREAVAAGYKKLMEYYDIAKKSQYTILATVLHPSLRAEWFRNLGEDVYQQTAALLHHVYDVYATEHAPASAQPPPPPDAAQDEIDDFLASISACPAPPPVQRPKQRSEVERWLAGDGGPGDRQSPLAWWKV